MAGGFAVGPYQPAYQQESSPPTGCNGFQKGAFQLNFQQCPLGGVTSEVRRSRRPHIRPIQDGYGLVEGVEGHGYVGKPVAHGYAREGIPGVASITSRDTLSEVGVVIGGAGGHATPKNLRPVRGSLGEPLPHAGGCATHTGYESKSFCGTATAHGAGVARTYLRASAGQIGKVVGKGVINPTDEELIAVVVALRRKRKI